MANDSGAPDQGTVKRILDQAGLSYGTDGEGDLFAAWEGRRTYFLFLPWGEDAAGGRVFTVRTFYERPFRAEDRPALLDHLDVWHRGAMWPKVHTYPLEGGELRLVSEAELPIGPGVGVEQFTVCLVAWVSAAGEFQEWLTERLDAPPTARAGRAARAGTKR
ncbi:YbjN domain-containing protein [Streptomyces sp. NPDC001941]|uniref:YbjN domain-containing protein n=1 Tax=Streptomyces sp. NPDC001941 TaxID=3154659 RepID=UPI0033291722